MVTEDARWIWTDKVDGTNIRIIWNDLQIRFGGKTNEAQIPLFFLNVLQEKFTPEGLMQDTFGDAKTVCICGEGYGRKIQKGENYLSDRQILSCLLYIDGGWPTLENLFEVAMKIGIDIVQVIVRVS